MSRQKINLLNQAIQCLHCDKTNTLIMKKVTYNLKCLFFSVLILLSFNSTAQKIAENRVDEFTKDHIVRTSWERIISNQNFGAFFRISVINERFYFELKWMDRIAFSVDQGMELLIKMQNEDIISLRNTEYKMSCIGCGSIGLGGSSLPGVHLIYPIEKETITKLKDYNVIKLRIYTSKGYIESEIKEKFAKRIKGSAALI